MSPCRPSTWRIHCPLVSATCTCPSTRSCTCSCSCSPTCPVAYKDSGQRERQGMREGDSERAKESMTQSCCRRLWRCLNRKQLKTLSNVARMHWKKNAKIFSKQVTKVLTTMQRYFQYRLQYFVLKFFFFFSNNI